MLNRRIIVLVLLLGSSVLASSLMAPQARAVPLTGVVCFADPTTASSTAPCPASPTPKFNGPVATPAEQLRVGVFIQASDYLNGFAIILQADHKILKPAGVDLTGTVLITPTTPIVECLSGILVSGSTCDSHDNIDTIDFVVAGALGKVTTAPTTGLLFTAVYNITNTVPSTSIGFQTGCTGTSVSGFCITISNGVTPPMPVPETSQSASFGNSPPLPWLSMSANPTSRTASGTSTITVTANNGWPPAFGIDSISFTTQTSSMALTATMNPTSCTSPAACTATLTLSATSPGTYTAGVFGTYTTTDGTMSSTLVATASVSVIIGDFSVTVAPTSVTFAAGLTGASTVTVTSTNFVGTVSLSQGLTIPATGLTITFNPGTLSFTSSGAQTSTATFISSTQGLYHTQVKATSGAKVKFSSAMTVTVTPGTTNPDFGLGANPPTVSGPTGTPLTSTITVTPLNSFTGTVMLTKVDPAGATCTLTPSSISGGSGTSTLSCSATGATSFPLTVTGTSGSLVHTVDVGFTFVAPVQDFSISANPTTVPQLSAGVTGTSTITVLPINGFTGTINLAYSAMPTSGLTCTLTPNSVTLGSSGTSALSCTGTAAGSYSVTVTGSTTGLSHSASVAFTVVVPDFTLTYPTTIGPINPSAVGKANITVTPVYGFTGTIIFTVSTAPSANITVSLTPMSIITSGVVTLKVNATGAISSYTVTIVASSGSLSHTITVAVKVADFTFTVSPTTVIVPAGMSNSTQIMLSSIDRFNGTVSLSAIASAGLTIRFDSNSILLTAGMTRSIGMTVMTGASVVPGYYNVNFTITYRGLVKEGEILVTVPLPDYTMTPLPNSVTANPGTAGLSTVTLTSKYQFSGTLTLAASSSGSALSCSLSKTTLSVTPTTPDSTILSCSGLSGSYTVTVTATPTGQQGFAQSHSTLVAYTISDFAVSASPISITQPIQNPGTVTITVSGTNGFSGTVHLVILQKSSGLNVSLSPLVLTGPGTATLTVSSTVVGLYFVTVEAISGGVSHTVKITVTLTQPSPAANVFGVDPVIFYPALGIIAVGAAGAVFLLLRRSGQRKTTRK